VKNKEATLTRTDLYKFTLFISGMSSKSLRAIGNIQMINEKYLNKGSELTIIDIRENKEQAVLHQIIAVPTLIKTAPIPVRTIVGDLSDIEKVLRVLDI
jgi:circadian clock protein KaiB